MTEAELCAEFIAGLPKGWTAYPETAGWDILLVRDADGFQIGVEAKLTLNAKVICQAAESHHAYLAASPGPDCRAVLVPADKKRSDFATLLRLLGIVVLTYQIVSSYNGRKSWFYYPSLPGPDRYQSDDQWPEFMPAARHQLPDYIPDVQAGASSPLKLSSWKIKAIKIQILLERRGFVTRKDFKALDISMTRWTQARWIVPTGIYGQWKMGGLADLRKQHPVNFAQIEADFDKWAPPPQPEQLGLLK